MHKGWKGKATHLECSVSYASMNRNVRAQSIAHFPADRVESVIPQDNSRVGRVVQGAIRRVGQLEPSPAEQAAELQERLGPQTSRVAQVVELEAGLEQLVHLGPARVEDLVRSSSIVGKNVHVGRNEPEAAMLGRGMQPGR